jgi:hypothetical protein
MVEVDVLQRALSECWAAEVSGVSYYKALGERFPDHRPASALTQSPTALLVTCAG